MAMLHFVELFFIDFFWWIPGREVCNGSTGVEV
jgi:hypothetical protein